MNNWIKLGNIYHPKQHGTLCSSHAQLPIIAKGGDPKETLVFFTGRDANNRSLPFVAELRFKDDRFELRPLKEGPVMNLGRIGAFDDSGVMPTSALWVDGELYVYYIGWNTRQTVPYQNAVGLARFSRQDLRMERVFEGPVLDRSRNEPFFVGTMDVHLIDGVWKAWYLSCTEWRELDDHMEPRYLIKFAESEDGLSWQRDGTVSVPYLNDDEAIAGASVLPTKNGFHIYYTYRSILNYRTDPSRSYRIGFGESLDGRQFKRLDSTMNAFSMNRAQWESEMQAYPHVFDWNDSRMMLYNGNGFGQSGIGLAKMMDG
jgi:hypothetical protein